MQQDMCIHKHIHMSYYVWFTIKTCLPLFKEVLDKCWVHNIWKWFPPWGRVDSRPNLKIICSGSSHFFSACEIVGCMSILATYKYLGANYHHQLMRNKKNYEFRIKAPIVALHFLKTTQISGITNPNNALSWGKSLKHVMKPYILHSLIPQKMGNSMTHAKSTLMTFCTCFFAAPISPPGPQFSCKPCTQWRFQSLHNWPRLLTIRVLQLP